MSRDNMTEEDREKEQKERQLAFIMKQEDKQQRLERLRMSRDNMNDQEDRDKERQYVLTIHPVSNYNNLF